MKAARFSLTLSALALGLAFVTGAAAEGLTKEGYKAKKDTIEAAYKADKAECGSLSGNQKDICVAKAKGKENVDLAELEANYKPSAKSRYDLAVARAEADYEVAKQQCDDKAGNAKTVCLKDAKAAETAAKSEARSAMK